MKFQGSVLFPLSRKSQERFLTKSIPILTITPCSHKWGVMPMKAVNRAGLKYRSQVTGHGFYQYRKYPKHS